MGYKPTEDFERMEAISLLTGNPTCLACNSTGAVSGALSAGRYLIASNVECYFKRGASTLATSDVLVDESTPSTSNPLFAGTYVPINVTDATNNYIACKTTGASGVFWILKTSLTVD